MSNDDTAVDVYFWHGCTPPVIVPVSTRAKLLLEIPNGAGGILFQNSPEEVLSLFPPHYTFAAYPDDEYFGEPIHPATLIMEPDLEHPAAAALQ